MSIRLCGCAFENFNPACTHFMSDAPLLYTIMLYTCIFKHQASFCFNSSYGSSFLFCMFVFPLLYGSSSGVYCYCVDVKLAKLL